MIQHKQSQRKKTTSKVTSFSRRERQTYPGFEGKVMIFDEAAALGPAQLVELNDIEPHQQRKAHE